MHQITPLKWPSVEDLYPHVGMSGDWPAECVPPATSPAASLPAPAAEQGGRAIYGQRYAFALQFSQPMGFWHAPCGAVSMSRFDGAYR